MTNSEVVIDYQLKSLLSFLFETLKGKNICNFYNQLIIRTFRGLLLTKSAICILNYVKLKSSGSILLVT